MSTIPLPGKNIKGVYRGYMPIGLPQHRPPNRIKPWMRFKGKPVYTLYPKQEREGYSEVAEYPPINDGTPKGLRAQIRYDWYDKLKLIPSVEEKLHEIYKHGNHYVAHTHNYIGHYNALPLVQYLTNTRLLNGLPDDYNNGQAHSQQLIDEIKNNVLDQIALDRYQSTKFQPRFVTKTYSSQVSRTREDNLIVQNIYQSVKKRIAIETNPQLLDYQHDLDPAIRSWWYHSGFDAPNNKIFFNYRKDDQGRINQMIQMDGGAAINLRSSSFLEPPVTFDDPLVNERDAIQEYCSPLKEYGFRFKFAHPVALTGQWFTENTQYDFPHTTFLTSQCLQLRHHKSYKVVKPLVNNEDCLVSQAIMTGFGWMNSLATYHGFTPFQEIEYPFTCQVITTNGKDWLFNVYQLNSHSFHRDLGGPKRNNICWSSGLMQLYKDFDGSTFHEVNDEVIRLLITLLSKQTNAVYTNNLNLKPYLGQDSRSDEEIESQKSLTMNAIKQKKNKWQSYQWKIALWERIFFRWKPARYGIREMKARYHIPKPKYPKIFE